VKDPIARRFDDALNITRRNEAYAAQRYTAECADWPTLQLDDVSGIPFLNDIVGVEKYQLRARVRAGDGDVFAATCPGMPDYEIYNRDYLGLGSAEFVHAPWPENPIEIGRGCRHGEAFDALVAFAKRSGKLVVHPYMGVESVWEMARDLAEASGARVAVLGPPPPVTWFANDKDHLSALVEAVHGPQLLCATLRGSTPEALAEHLLTLAQTYDHVALKMTRCASAMGNWVLTAADVRRTHKHRMVERVQAFLREKEWVAGDPVLAVSWEDNECSPSSQLWIPPLGAGDPCVDGVYEQLLEGPEKVFLGSVPSTLGAELDSRIGDASVAVARVYQQLGYVGRCSFDFIAPGDALRFVECNGRWGGTSTPMHLLDRVFPEGRPAYRARDYVGEHMVGWPFTRLMEAIGDDLYDVRTGRGRFILYNVGCLTYGKFDVIAIGEDIDAAERALEDELPEMIG